MELATDGPAGLAAERLRRIDAVMQDTVDRGLTPGVVTLLARHGTIVHCHACGLMDREAGTAMQLDTICRIYSMSKPVTCTAAMMLYEEGRFLLDDPLARYIPAFENVKVYAEGHGTDLMLVEPERPVTIHHLLTHTAGISYAGLPGTPVATLYADANFLSPLIGLRYPLAELADRLAALPLVAQPGTRFHYSLAHDLLGYVIEVISGQAFDEFLAERLFGPLGMHDTGFYVPPEKTSRFAALYGPAGENGLPLLDAPSMSVFTRRNYHPSGGGGLVSTASDYARFAQMLLNGGQLEGRRLLSPRTVQFMTRNHLVPSPLALDVSPGDMRPGYGYGLGLGVLLNPGAAGILGSEGQYGWDGAATTQFWIDPCEDMLGVIMAQVLPWIAAPRIMHLFQVLAHQAIVDR
jgi:CubicO group peptidase (beta-lactamase class C family)